MKAVIRSLVGKFRMEALLAIPYGWYYRLFFRKFGRGAFVSPFIQGVGLDCVSLGSRSRISRNTRLLALRAYGQQSFSPHIDIGSNVSIGFGCTLSCVNRIKIGDDVTIGDNVYLADSHHSYANPTMSILDQPLLPGDISIGRGAWIGYGAFVAGNVSVGDYAVVGANSVVTRPVPAYTVVAGVPARPIRKFDSAMGQWVRIDAVSQENLD